MSRIIGYIPEEKPPKEVKGPKPGTEKPVEKPIEENKSGKEKD